MPKTKGVNELGDMQILIFTRCTTTLCRWTANLYSYPVISLRYYHISHTCNGLKSGLLEAKIGVPQGSFLVPLFFIFFIN